MFVIVDRRIVGWFAKNLSENGILCVHVIGYKLGYKIIYKLEHGIRCGQDLDIQAMIQRMIQDLQGIIQDLVQFLQGEVQELFTSFIRCWIFGWNTKGTSGCIY
jgi:hypothetical protein